MHHPSSLAHAAGGWFHRQLSGLVVALTAVMAAQPLVYGLPRGHDTLLHLYRIPLLESLWSQGVLYARWMPDLLMGYGYPLFLFYPPLSGYLIAVLDVLLGHNAPLALTVAFALAIALAAVSAYFLARELYGAGAAVFVAAAYAFSPHLLYSVYARGSISSALALGLYPLALWTVLRLVRRPGRSALAVLALATAGLQFTHAGTSLIVFGTLGVIGVAACITSSSSRRTTWLAIIEVVAGLVLGLVLSASVWLPALGEIGSTHYGETLMGPDVHWSRHWADVFSLPALPMDRLRNAPLPFSPGIAQVVLGVLGLVCALAAALVAWKRGKQVTGADVLAITIGLLGVGAVIMATPLSSPIWERSALVRRLQYPWRFLDAGTLLLALASGRVVAGVTRRQCLGVALVVLSTMGMLLNALPYMYPARHDDLSARPSLAEVSEYQRTSGALGLTSWGEYLPITVRGLPENVPTGLAVEGATLDKKVWLPDEIDLVASSGGPLAAQLQLDATSAAPVRFATFWFAGWVLTLDGEPAASWPDAQGLLSVEVPAGRHLLSVRWGSTPLRQLADGLSLAGLAAIIVLLVARRRGAEAGLSRPSHGGDTRVGATTRPVIVAVGAVLLLFSACKTAVLDRTNTPLVRHVHNACPDGITCPPWGDYGYLRLLGYKMHTDSSVDLYWEADVTPPVDYAVELRISDISGEHVLTVHSAHPGGLPTSGWHAGDLVFSHYQWPPSEGTSPTAYRLAVALVDPGSGAAVIVTDAPDVDTVEVPLGLARYPVDPPEPTAVEIAMDYRFGDVIGLTGVCLPTDLLEGQALDYALRWEALAQVRTDYTVFVHLLDAAGDLVSGNDSQPLGGNYPTSVWARGEEVLDTRQWLLDVTPGEYSVEVGLYSLATGERLTVSGASEGPGDRVIVGSVTVHPGTESAVKAKAVVEVRGVARANGQSVMAGSRELDQASVAPRELRLQEGL